MFGPGQLAVEGNAKNLKFIHCWQFAVSKIEVRFRWSSLPREYHGLTFGLFEGDLPLLSPYLHFAEVSVQSSSYCIDVI